ncbi:hypothetical protein, partial [Vogesella mureinivorans]|uniref:hypothetical protein n=1 Tax=Vogesella mureinivorans TaxID=657276 RepID=UPI0011C9FA60
VENGIYIVGAGSFSIDQQRYNAQFGGQLFYEIKDGMRWSTSQLPEAYISRVNQKSYSPSIGWNARARDATRAARVAEPSLRKWRRSIALSRDSG